MHWLLLITHNHLYHPRRYKVGIFETHFFGETLFKESTTGIPYSFTKYYTVLIIAFKRFLKSVMFFFNIASKLILYLGAVGWRRANPPYYTQYHSKKGPKFYNSSHNSKRRL